MKPEPPRVAHLTRAQYEGWRCCWCGKSLMDGGVSAGIARGGVGAHVLDVEVYECGPECPRRPRPPRRPEKKDSQEGTP